MKKQPSPESQPKFDQQDLKQLMLRRRIIDKQIENIKSMPLHQLLDKNRKKQPILPPSPTKNFMRKNIQNQLRAAGFQHNLQQIVDRQMKMYEQAERRNTIIRKQMRQAPVFSQIKRGKLGLDSVFILFAILGSITLPIIFYTKFKQNRDTIVKSRKYSPEFIQNITDDSPVDIDAVSEQSIHYDNPKRRMQFQEAMSKAQQVSALKRDLDL